jgi:uracil-DNA glycosylase
VPLLTELVDRIPKDYQDLVHTFLSNQTHQLALSRIAELEKNTRSQYPSEIFPAYGDVFNALIQTPVNSVKVILIGQDPYHSPGLAQGLAFSIPEHIATSSRAFPSSLRNISKALVLDDFDPLPHGNLISWAQQGVLLLNTCLTVNMGNAHSHQAWGWQLLTDAIIQALSEQNYISKQEASSALEQSIEFHQEESSPSDYGYYITPLREVLVEEMPKLNITSGLEIFSCMDARFQQAAQKALRDGLLKYNLTQKIFYKPIVKLGDKYSIEDLNQIAVPDCPENYQKSIVVISNKNVLKLIF